MSTTATAPSISSYPSIRTGVAKGQSSLNGAPPSTMLTACANMSITPRACVCVVQDKTL